MGCGCSKGGQRNVTKASGQRPLVTPQNASVSKALTAAKTPSELRAVVMQKVGVSPTGLDAERRKNEKIRRDTIRRAFGGK